SVKERGGLAVLALLNKVHALCLKEIAHLVFIAHLLRHQASLLQVRIGILHSSLRTIHTTQPDEEGSKRRCVLQESCRVSGISKMLRGNCVVSARLPC